MMKVVRTRRTYTVSRRDLIAAFDLWQKDYQQQQLGRYPKYAKFVKESKYGEKVVDMFISYIEQSKTD